MPDQSLIHAQAGQAAPFALAVIGAGIAGLNALFAARDYLAPGDRVLLVDRRAAPGGMWHSAYEYVRLHQPHPMFTVGSIPWAWDRPASYLAKRDEVRDHLVATLGPIAETLRLETRFGHEVTACCEAVTPAGPRAEITLHPTGAPEAVQTLTARRAIFAAGFDYAERAPFTLSSAQVTALAPSQLRAALTAATTSTSPGAPVYVVGGGKTGMDSVLETLAQDLTRPVTLINGAGTAFMNRTKYAPTGLRRWTSGAPFSALLRDIALCFTGDNEAETLAHFCRHHSTAPDTDNGGFAFGFQSEAERAQIDAGLRATVADYLVDVTDSPGGPVMQLRSGAEAPVPPGSLFVDCTGSFFRSVPGPRLPCLTPHNTVLRIGHRDALHFHTSVSGFFSTHLFLRDALRGRGLYTIDHDALFRANKAAWTAATAAQAYLYHLTMVASLPMSVLGACLLDLDRWYPLPRRLWWFAQMKRSAEADAAHCRAVLDRVAARFGVPAEPLV